MAEVNGTSTTAADASTPGTIAADPTGSNNQPAPATELLPPAPDAATFSTSIDADSKRPRDARLMHMVLANLGISAYHERVPLQLLDFAYRYTSTILQDAQLASSLSSNNNNNNTANANVPVDLPAVRLAVASKLNYQFQSSLPKSFLMELAAEKNRIQLPAVGKEWGLRLPPEKYVLTGTGFSLKEEWESETSDEDEEEGGKEKEDGDGEDEEEDGDAKMEDLFGKQEDGDEDMNDA
jgi:transcription initiation factor TFIID subunit 9B